MAVKMVPGVRGVGGRGLDLGRFACGGEGGMAVLFACLFMNAIVHLQAHVHERIQTKTRTHRSKQTDEHAHIHKQRYIYLHTQTIKQTQSQPSPHQTLPHPLHPSASILIT